MAKYCANCGCSLKDEDLFCPNCGFRQPEPFTPDTNENNAVSQPDQLPNEIPESIQQEQSESVPDVKYDNHAIIENIDESHQNNTAADYGNGTDTQYQNYNAGAPYIPQGYGQFSPYQVPAPIEKKKSIAKILIIVSAAILILGGIAAILLFVAPGFLKGDENPGDTTSTQAVTETATTVATDTSTTFKSDAPSTTAAVTSSTSTETVTTSTTEAATTSPEKKYSDFEYYGLYAVSDFDEDYTREYDYHTYVEAENKEIDGKIVISNYMRMRETEDIIAFGEQNGIDFAGYDAVLLLGNLIFNDDDIEEGNDPNIYPVSYDYYDIKTYQDTLGLYRDTDNNEYTKATVEIDGELRDIYVWVDISPIAEEGVRKYEFMFLCFVPNGYDGLVAGFAHGAEEGNDNYLYNMYDPFTFKLFRLN